MSGGGGGDDAIKFQKEAAKKAYEYDTKTYKYQWGDNAQEGQYVRGGEIHRKYAAQYDAYNKQRYAARDTRQFQQDSAQDSYNYGRQRVDFEYDMQRRAQDQQKLTDTRQRTENTLTKLAADANARLIRDEQLQQQSFNSRQILQEFLQDQGTFGFDRERLLNDLGLNEERLDSEVSRARSDLNTARNLSGGSIDRQRLELQIKENQLNTKQAQSDADLASAVTKAASATDITQRTADLTEGKLLSEEQKARTVLSQRTGDAGLDRTAVELSYTQKAGDIAASKTALTQDYTTKEAATKFNRSALGIDTAEVKQRRDYQTDAILRDLQNQKAQAKFGATKANIEALTKAGQAQVSQAGRSQGKSIVAFMGEVGRQQAEMVDTLIRAQSAGEEKVRQTKMSALNDIQRSSIKSQQLDLQSLENLNKLSLGIDQANRDLRSAGDIKGLELSKITKGVADATELTNLTVKDLQREIGGRKGLTIANLQDIQKDLASKQRDAAIQDQDISQTRQGEADLSTNRIQALLDELSGKQDQFMVTRDSVNQRRSLLQQGSNIGERKISKGLADLSTRYGLNQEIVNAMKDSASNQYQQALSENQRAKSQADLTSRARVMIDPQRSPYAPAPRSLPVVEFVEPTLPKVPPEPIEGAKMSYGGMGALDAAMAVGGGALAGVSAYAGLKAAGMVGAATPVGWAIGIGSVLASFL